MMEFFASNLQYSLREVATLYSRTVEIQTFISPILVDYLTDSMSPM